VKNLQILGQCCDANTLSSGDPTGTIISSNKPIFASSGVGNGLITVNGYNGGDYEMEMLPPLNELGMKYIVVSSMSGDLIKIIGECSLFQLVQKSTTLRRYCMHEPLPS
jgi:IgGFc binding protein